MTGNPNMNTSQYNLYLFAFFHEQGNQLHSRTLDIENKCGENGKTPTINGCMILDIIIQDIN